MSFGQAGGPPATTKQMQYLLALLKAAGHDGFRDARRPLGLTQRQAGGKFTMKEASALIDQLTGTAGDGDGSDAAARSDTQAVGPELSKRDANAEIRAEREAERAAARLAYRQAEVLGGIPADMLVGELERRGWTCTPPD